MNHRRGVASLFFALLLIQCQPRSSMEYTGGEVTGLTVTRTDQRIVQFSFTVPDDGTGQSAAVEIRGAAAELGEWWWGDVANTPLGRLPSGAAAPGSAISGLTAVLPFDLDGRTMRFAAVASRFDEEEGKNKFSRVTPDDRIGLEIDFGIWEDREPEPEPEPEPTPALDNPVVSAVPVEGAIDTLVVTWADGSRAELRRLSPWRRVFGLTLAGWASKKLG